jgi:hypothetical protein
VKTGGRAAALSYSHFEEIQFLEATVKYKDKVIPEIYRSQHRCLSSEFYMFLNKSSPFINICVIYRDNFKQA